MAATFAEVNGIRIAYRVQGAGTPLVLVMDISSAAWPPVFVEALARQFTVITLDSRGTGFSDKPVHGNAIANLVRDIHGLLAETRDSSRPSVGLFNGGRALLHRSSFGSFWNEFKARCCARRCAGGHAQLTPNRQPPE